MDSGQDTRRGWLTKGIAAALGVMGAAGGVAVANDASRASEQDIRQEAFNPVAGEIVRLQPGTSILGEVLRRYPGESDTQTAAEKLSRAAGPNAANQQNVDHFFPKEAPSKWPPGEYRGFAEGSRVGKNVKIQEVDPLKKQVTLEITAADGRVDNITVSTDYNNDPQKNKPFSFKDEEGNTYVVVAALGRKREEIKNNTSLDTVQIADRVVMYITTPAQSKQAK